MPTNRLGRYEVLKPLGSGSFASVYLALDPRLDVEVAVKVLGDIHCSDPDMRRRFIQEARFMRRIGSPHLVSIFDIDEAENGQPFFVMEYLAHGNLAERLERLDYIKTEEIRRLVSGLADSMSVVHHHGYLHRDIKPGNLLIRPGPAADSEGSRDGLLAPGESLVLADFGLAKDVSGSTHLTVIGGTRAYMAPEQLDASIKADLRADLHAASAVIFEAVTGFVPQDAERVTESNFPDLLAELWVGMSADPDQRHGSAQQWGEALLATLPEAGADAPKKSKKVHKLSARPKRQRRIISALGVALVAAIAALAYVSFFASAADSSAIVGTRRAKVGQKLVFSKDLAADSTSVWIKSDGTEVTKDYLLAEPASPGVFQIRLVETKAGGTKIDHVVEVHVDE